MTEQEPNAPEADDRLVLSSPDEASTPKDFLLWAGVILLMVLSIYAPALHGRFIWDDERHVSENPTLRAVGGLWNIWTGHIRLWAAPESERKNVPVYTPQYYPLVHTTFWLEYQLTGQKPGEIDPTIFHVDNAILHAAGAILLWFLLRELELPGAWVVAAVFAVHPIEGESVAWISERKNVLAGAFYFGSLLAFTKWALRRDRTDLAVSLATREDWTFYGVSLLLFVLALLSKSVTCSLPAVALLLIWWKRGRVTTLEILATLPFFILGGLIASFTGWVETHHVGASGDAWDLRFVERILIAGRAVWFYVGKILWPAKLTFIYPRWDLSANQPALWVFPIAVVAVLVALFVLRNRIGRGPVVAWAIFVGVLTPALGFVNFYPMRYSFVADHFQYLAGPALMTLIICSVARLLKRRRVENAAGPSPTPYVFSGIVLLVFAVLTVRHAMAFESNVTLWTDVVGKTPTSWMAQNNLGTALFGDAQDLPTEEAEKARQMLDSAEEHFAKAVELWPGHERAWANWGRLLVVRHQPEKALDKLDRALALNPDNVDALIDRSRALLELKRLPESKEAFNRALAAAEKQPTQPVKVAAIHQFLGRIARQQNDTTAALDQYRQATALAPQDASIHYEYGTLLMDLDRRQEAAVAFATAIALRPQDLDPHIDLALLRLKVNNIQGARMELARAGEIAREMEGRGQPLTKEQAERLLAAGKRWSAVYEASTRPSTTRASTTNAATAPAAPSTRIESVMP